MSGMHRATWPSPQLSGATRICFKAEDCALPYVFGEKRKMAGLNFRLVSSVLATFAIVKVNTLSTMKKINWWRAAFFLLMVGMVVLEGCRLFKPKCDCPHF